VNEHFLLKKLEERTAQQALRQLRFSTAKIDFCSNDYLGIARNKLVGFSTDENHDMLSLRHGSTGSRLITGNYPLIEETENQIATFHKADAALLFNSGYDANVGLLLSATVFA
jgi:8-amino-7-oxononanoate synthase